LYCETNDEAHYNNECFALFFGGSDALKNKEKKSKIIQNPTQAGG